MKTIKPTTRQVLFGNWKALPLFAGICNSRRNVAGLMPHPERACESLLGGDDGKWIFESIFAALEKKTAAQAA